MLAEKAPTKGERTAARILDAAELQFANRGFEAASLREIARQAGIKEPGLYNYFSGKEALYAAVLDRALTPMAEAMQIHMASEEGIRAYASLPAVMTDLLLEHPQMASLFQQALQGDTDSVGTQLIKSWLDRLFAQGMETMKSAGLEEVDVADQAVQIIAMFNLTTGYFLSQRAFASMADGHVTDAENIARQKKLLSRIQRAILLS
jgi:AcrR family transcriptional regulator